MAVLIVFAAVVLSASIAPALALAPTCDCDICVNETGRWHDRGAFIGNGTTVLQAAVDDVDANEMICMGVEGSDYDKNVNEQLTLAGEGTDVVNVVAANLGSEKVVVDFEGLGDWELVSEYYNGGYGGGRKWPWP